MIYNEGYQLARIADTLDKILKVVVVTMSKEEQKKVLEILKTPKAETTSLRPEQVYKKAVNTLKRKALK